MISFLKGRIDSVSNEAVVVDVNNVGYRVFVPKANTYLIDQEVKLLTYHVIKQEEQFLVGFATIEERNLFLTLIKVQGVGSKTALAILSVGSPSQIINAINSDDIKYLKSLPLVGYKTARQIIYELKGYYASSDIKSDMYSDVRNALISLGFKVTSIDTTLHNFYKDDISEEDLLKMCLKELRK